MIKKALLIVAAVPILFLIWPGMLIYRAYRKEDPYLVALGGAGFTVIWILGLMWIVVLSV